MSLIYTEAFEARRKLARFFETPYARSLVASWARQGHPDGWWTPQQELLHLADSRRVLRDAPIHYVSTEVCETLEAHASLLPPDEVLKRSSFLHPEAFYYFATPWMCQVGSLKGRIAYRETLMMVRPGGIIVNTFGRDLGPVDPMAVKQGRREDLDPRMICESAEWAYGYPIEPGWSPDEETRQRDRLLRQRLLALALFERQTLTVAHHEQADRATRRRFARESPEEELPAIRVIHLRRSVPAMPPEHDDDDQEGDVQRRRRHWVQPFWRKQWYPSESDHHPKLVVGHWRGEGEDITSAKVFVVDR